MSLYPDHLPVRLAPFVGRQDDLVKILDLIQLSSVQLITILGAGGIGKTRLAIELTRILRDRFQHGAVFIPLAQLSTTDELLPALAGALGVQLPPGCDLQETVIEHLTTRQTVLVFDNFEHLLNEAVLICAMSGLIVFNSNFNLPKGSCMRLQNKRGKRKTYNNSGATNTMLPITCPLSSSELALLASRMGNRAAITGSIFPSSNSLKSAAQSSRKGCQSHRESPVLYGRADLPSGNKLNQMICPRNFSMPAVLCGLP